MSKRKKLEYHIRKTLLFFLIFFFIYKVSFPIIPAQITSRRLSSVLLFVFALIDNHFKLDVKRKDSVFWHLILLFCVIVLHLLGLLIFVGEGYGNLALESFGDFVVFMPFAFWGITRLFKSEDELMETIKNVSILQAIIIIICIANSTVRGIIANVFYSQNYWGENYSIDQLFLGGYQFGIGCITSTGALQLGFGLIAITFFFFKGTKKTIVLAIELVLIIFAEIALARTGLVLSIVSIICILSFKKDLKHFIITIVVFIFIAFIAYMLIVYSSLGSRLERVFQRLIRLVNNHGISLFFDSYFHGSSTSIPPVSKETLIGTGVISGTSGNGVYVNVDGGFLKNYVGLGLIVALFFYAVLCIMIIKRAKNSNSEIGKRIILMSLLFLLIGEFKEYFIVGFPIVLVFAFIQLQETPSLFMHDSCDNQESTYLKENNSKVQSRTKKGYNT